MTHHHQHPPIVVHRNGVLRFIDWDYGFRPIVPASPPHVRGHQTRKAPTVELARAMRPHVGLGA